MEKDTLREHAHKLITESIESGDVYDVFRHISVYVAAVRAELLFKHPSLVDPNGKYKDLMNKDFDSPDDIVFD